MEDNADETVEKQINEELERTAPKVRTFQTLTEYALDRGVQVDTLKSMLKQSGYSVYKPENHDKMEMLIE